MAKKPTFTPDTSFNFGANRPKAGTKKGTKKGGTKKQPRGGGS